MKTGLVKESDYGNLSFKFEDGTTAIAYWIPEGDYGDGDGGGFDEDSVEVGDSGLSAAEVVRLANANTGVMGRWVPIKQPR